MKKQLLALLLGLLTCSLIAQESSPAEYFANLQYRSVGPSRGGRATAVTGIPGKPFSFLMGATGGGVWKTTDAGNSWQNISDGQILAGSIGAIQVAPSDENIIYVGTGSAAPRGNVSPGIGIYKSSDGGKHWEHTGLEKAGQIGKIVVHPKQPELVYVAALGQIFGKNKERGVYRSKNGGESWELILHISDSTGIIDLAINPHNPREIYAAGWRAERKPYTLIDGGPEGGIWKSTDEGDNWKKLSGGLPSGLIGKIGLALSPARADRVWAVIQTSNEDQGGVWRSDDGGQNWTRTSRDHQLRQRGWYYSDINAHPTNENTVFVSNVGLFKSVDGGKTFDNRIRSPHSDHHGVWINPDNPDIMIICNDGGASVSLNGGKTWSSQLNQPTSEFYRVTVDNQFPYRLYAGQQDNTTISIPSRDPGGITDTENWYAVGGSECGDVAVHPDNPNIVWAGSYSGEITIINRKTGQERQVTAYPHYTEGTEQRKLKYRWQWNFPITIHPDEPNTVYHTSNYVHKTTDNGQNWTRISPDLTRNLDQYHDIPGGPIQHDATGVEVYSSIFAFEISPHNKNELWAGSDDGLLHISKDAGKNWENITPKDMPFEGTINKIELSTHAPGRAFIAVYNYRYNDFTPYIYRTDDYGKNWKKITKGIADQHFARAIAEDPDRKGLLFAGTEFGMYISFDSGDNWHPFQLNLPHVPITDMEIHQQDLVISTQGRAFWILDDLTPLHQVDLAFPVRENKFFKPRIAYRTNISGYQARIPVFLTEKPDKLTIEIFDNDGEPVRTLSTDSNNRLHKISAQKGLNIIEWDLRHTGPEVVDNLVTMVIGNPASGPYAVPGTYRVRVSNGSWQAEQTLQLSADPRWTDVSTEDYTAQLEMAQEISQIITESHQRIKNIRALREQMKNIGKLAEHAGKGNTLREMAENIGQKLTAVEDQLIQNKAEASQDNINYPRVFSNHIGRLYSVLVYAHDRPTGGVIERYTDLKKEYNQIITAYDQVTKTDIPAFSQKMQELNVAGLIIPQKIKDN